MQSFDSYVEGVSKLKAGGSRTVPNRLLTNNIWLNFFFSDGWFAGFKKRYKISLRRATNSCQKPPESKKEAIRHCHHLFREISL